MDKKITSLQTRQDSSSYTATVAQHISRRSFLKSAGALALAIGLSLKLSDRAVAHTLYPCSSFFPPNGCYLCEGDCNRCNSLSPNCCHPTGGICVQSNCVCSGCWDACKACRDTCNCSACQACRCGSFRSRVLVCVDGHYKTCCTSNFC